MAKYHSVSLTTTGSGAGSAYSATVDGRIIAIKYDGSMASGADITITTEDTGLAVITKANAGTAAVTYYPRNAMNKVADGAAVAFYTPVHACMERLKVSVVQGGNAQTGAFTFVTDG